MIELSIIGGSTLGITLGEIAVRTGKFSVRGFFDDQPDRLLGAARNSWLGPISEIANSTENSWQFALALGSNDDRWRIYGFLQQIGLAHRLATLIDPQAIVLGTPLIGRGSIIFPGAVVGPETTIGIGSIVNSNTFIGANCSIGNFVNLCPGACLGASAILGDQVYMGMHSSVLQGLAIAAKSKIGAGAVVLENVQQSGVFAGVPARPITGN